MRVIAPSPRIVVVKRKIHLLPIWPWQRNVVRLRLARCRALIAWRNITSCCVLKLNWAHLPSTLDCRHSNPDECDQMKTVLVVLTFIFVILQYRLWLSHDGLPALLRLHHTVEKQRIENSKLEERNQVLAAEVADLKSGLDALEERARSELGMVKPEETFFHIIDIPENEE